MERQSRPYWVIEQKPSTIAALCCVHMMLLISLSQFFLSAALIIILVTNDQPSKALVVTLPSLTIGLIFIDRLLMAVYECFRGRKYWSLDSEIESEDFEI